MDHFGIVRRAFQITWRYRMLWVFGFLLAACTGGAGGGGGGGNTGFQVDRGDLGRFGFGVPPLTAPDLGPVIGVIIAVLIILAFVAILFALISVAIRYISETALIRAVDDYETTGIRRSLGDGIRMGWSWRAGRLFLIDLVVSIPVLLAFAFFVFLALAPLLLWITGSETAGAIGVVITIGLMLLLVMVGILVAIALSILQPFFWRAAVLDNLGVFDSIRRGFRIVRDRFKDAAVMWLILVGLQIAYGLAVAVFAVVLGLVALIVGGVIGWLVYTLSSLVFYASTPVILGVLAGVPIGLALLTVPLLLVSALAAVYRSTFWTLTYRELRA